MIEMDNNSFETNNTSYMSTPKKTRGKAAKVVAFALCCSLVGGVVGAGSIVLLDNLRSNGESMVRGIKNESTILMGDREAEMINLSYVDTGKEMTPAEIYANNVNSTVGITTSITTNYFGYQTEAAASGSGFILTADGYIVTNAHVVEGANEIKVTTYNNKVYDAKLIGADESNDLAVLKIEAEGLTPVVLGDSDIMNVGDSVVAIGNPLGELTFSLTSGTVSALNRKITINNSAMNLIQTDCAINSGNSGGALFNSHGEVIGITNAKYCGDSSSATVDNIGFAIPINSVRDIITSIIEKGYIDKPYVGISVYTLTSDYKKDGIEGAYVYSVEEGSPADEAGLKADDVITEVNGTKISGYEDLCGIISQSKEGDKLKLTVVRGGETVTEKITVKVRQQSVLPQEKSNFTGKPDQGFDGQFPFEFDEDDRFPG